LLESVILSLGGSVLVRRRIQTPSDAKVLSVVQPEGEVVLGASPPARHYPRKSGRPVPGATMTTFGGFSYRVRVSERARAKPVLAALFKIGVESDERG
jgi:hypothetical protein